MSDDYFTALADNATKTVKETQKVSSQVLTKNSGLIPKVFTVAFVALLLYMGFNFAKINTYDYLRNHNFNKEYAQWPSWSIKMWNDYVS